MAIKAAAASVHITSFFNARLPMRMIARQLGYAETEEEREQRKAKGREQMQGIKNLLKGGKVTGAKA